jgi:hypothetical protein
MMRVISRRISILVPLLGSLGREAVGHPYIEGAPVADWQVLAAVIRSICDT